MQDIIDPPNTQFLKELHDALDELIVSSAELLLGPSVSIILEKPQRVSEEKCGNKCSLRFTVHTREPGHAPGSALIRVDLSASMWRKI